MRSLFFLLLSPSLACIDYVGPPRVPHAKLSIIAEVMPNVLDTLVVRHAYSGVVQRVTTGEVSCVTIEVGNYLVEMFYLSEDTELGRMFPPTRYVWAQRDGLDHTVWFFGVGGGIISTDSVSTGVVC